MIVLFNLPTVAVLVLVAFAAGFLLGRRQ